MPLVEWHDRLQDHFGSLCQSRSDNSNLVFALEHGLSEEEISRLQADVCAYIQKYSPTKKHWLPWVVYASELGYRYVGEEYWQTFEECTRGWRDRGPERSWLRDRFVQFQHEFKGAVPLGPWAEHFTIICHPITHAILPTDFQGQLADVLYQVGPLFTVEILQSPELLGRLIASYSEHKSNRFQKFVENEKLVGLIAKAMLSNEGADTGDILLPATLRRIVRDLEGEKHARDRLRDARNYANVTRSRGLTRGNTGPHTTLQLLRGANAGLVVVEPRLVLCRTNTAVWDLQVEIPDFTPLLKRHPKWRDFLSGARCSITGASGAYFPRGQLLWGSRLAILRSFPRPNDHLLKFETEPPDELADFIERDFGLGSDPVRLCRIAADGRAYQLQSLRVSPGRRYIVLRTNQPFQNAPYLQRLEISCTGIYAALLDVPDSVTNQDERRIESLGLELNKTVSIYPVGVIPARWDGEGSIEWLAFDEPCVGIRADHWVDALELKLDEGRAGRLVEHLSDTGKPLFVQLPLLSIGTHNLEISVRSNPAEEFEPLGRLEITIREPSVWKPGVSNQGALIAITDPRHPTLEQLLQNRLNVDLHGPAGTEVACTASFFGKRSDAPLHILKRWHTFKLPVKPSSWKAAISHFLRRADVRSAVDAANACRIELDAGELGTVSLLCEREFVPLRWLPERKQGSYVLSLSDDSGSEERPRIERYEFDNPNHSVTVPCTGSLDHHVVPASGGLYLARAAKTSSSIIVPREQMREGTGTLADIADLAGSNFSPRFKTVPRTVASLLELLALYRTWLESRTVGSMTGVAQRRVLEAQVANIFVLIGGSNWASAESAYYKSPSDPAAIKRLSCAIDSAPNVCSVIFRQYHEQREASPEDHVAQLGANMQHLIKPISLPNGAGRAGALVGRSLRWQRGSRWQAQLALRLASAPETAQDWAGRWYETGLKELLRNPCLARAARFLVLATSNYLRLTDRNDQASLFAGWSWV